MRIDKYLKVSRLIKRRTVAAEACDGGRVLVGGKPVKPAYTVKVGDILEIRLGAKTMKIQVTKLSEHAFKEDADSMYTVIE